jgi:hypothetical protein
MIFLIERQRGRQKFSTFPQFRRRWMADPRSNVAAVPGTEAEDAAVEKELEPTATTSLSCLSFLLHTRIV